MKKRISEQVVVVTGASSGIGRETALQLARRGAQVVAAARNKTALQALVRSAEEAEGNIEGVATDVSDAAAMAELARIAVERFGRIDTWVNNAAVTMYATVDESDVAEMARIVMVNLLGQIHGVKAALPHMRAQGGGTIINVSSPLGWRGVPYQAAYVASKHGIKGFTESLRLELEHEDSGIDVTLLMPGSTNTPLFEHARSKLGNMPRPFPPVYEPSVVANAILHAAENPQRDIVVGGWGKALILAERISPMLTDWYLKWNDRGFRQQQTELPDDNRDNLFTPFEGAGRIHGIFGDESRTRSLYTRFVELQPWSETLVMNMVGAAMLGPIIGVATVFGLSAATARLSANLLSGLRRAFGLRRRQRQQDR